jgi:DNA-binding NarL/FixJ family response regulator
VFGMTKILIADDHDVVRSGLRALLSEQPNWQVVAEAADGKEAVAQVLKTAPDVAIVDYSLPVLNGVEVTRQIRQRSPGTEVIIFTMHDNNSLIHERGNRLPPQVRRQAAAIERGRYGLGVKTVETHLAAAHRKLGLNSTANLVRYAARNRIVEA